MAIAAVFAGGLYPVAWVNGSPIFYATWKKIEKSEKQFLNVRQKISESNRISAASSLEVFNDNNPSLFALSFLIDDKITEKEGMEVVKNLGELSQKRMNDTLAAQGDMSSAVKAVYGLSLNDFKRLILKPQARRDVLSVFLASQNLDYAEWLNQKKEQASVKIFFGPFSWNGKELNP